MLYQHDPYIQDNTLASLNLSHGPPLASKGLTTVGIAQQLNPVRNHLVPTVPPIETTHTHTVQTLMEGLGTPSPEREDPHSNEESLFEGYEEMDHLLALDLSEMDGREAWETFSDPFPHGSTSMDIATNPFLQTLDGMGVRDKGKEKLHPRTNNPPQDKTTGSRSSALQQQSSPQNTLTLYISSSSEDEEQEESASSKNTRRHSIASTRRCSSQHVSRHSKPFDGPPLKDLIAQHFEEQEKLRQERTELKKRNREEQRKREKATAKKKRTNTKRSEFDIVEHLGIGERTEADDQVLVEEFDVMMLRRDEDVTLLPKAYFAFGLMDDHLVDKNQNMRGIRPKKLCKRLPSLAPILWRCHQKAMGKKDSFTRRVIEEQEKRSTKFRQVSSHARQGCSDLCTSLGQFFAFLRTFESKPGERFTFTMRALLSQRRIEAYSEYLDRCARAPATIRNRMLHLRKVLKFMKGVPALKSFKSHITGAKLMVNHLTSKAVQNIQKYQAATRDEDVLKEQGKMFASVEEHVTYNRWCLIKWNNKVLASKKKGNGTPTMKQARMMQQILATLMMDFSGGQRRQVIAELRTDQIEWQGVKEFWLRLDAEKVLRTASDKLPMPNFLKNMVQYFIHIVRPVLLSAQRLKWKRNQKKHASRNEEEEEEEENEEREENENEVEEEEDKEKEYEEIPVYAMWIDGRGSALHINAFTQMLGALSKKFNPALDIKPKSYRYTHITAAFKGMIHWPTEFDQFLQNFSEFLNVRYKTMRTNYDRGSRKTTHKAVQDAINQSQVEALDDVLQETNNALQSLNEAIEQEMQSQQQEEAILAGQSLTPRKRLVRTTPDNLEWRKTLRLEALNRKKERKRYKKNLKKLLDAEEQKKKQEEKTQKRLEALEEMEKQAEAAKVKRLKTRYQAKQKRADELAQRRTFRAPPELFTFVTAEMRAQGSKEMLRNETENIEKEYEVKKIVDKGISAEEHRLMYKVKWRGYAQKTWVYFAEMQNCLEAIELYEVKHFTNRDALHSKETKK